MTVTGQSFRGLRNKWLKVSILFFFKPFVTYLDRVVRVWTDDRVDRVTRVHYEPVVRGTLHVLGIVGHGVRRIRHRQSGQLRVQITVGVLLKREYDEVGFARGL